MSKHIRPHPSLDGQDITSLDDSSFDSVERPSSEHPRQMLTRPQPTHRESSASFTDIRFRSDAAARTLYPGATPQLDEFAANTFPRKHSLVRPEDYLPSNPRFSTDLPFNPYQSPSWSTKPDEFDRDLASPYTSPKAPGSATITAASLFTQENVSTEHLAPAPVFRIEYDTLKSNSRTLGGKKLVTSGEWRKKMQLDPQTVREKDFDEKAAEIYLGKMPQPDLVPVQTQQDTYWQTMSRGLSPLTALLFVLSNIVYIGYRLGFLLQAERDTNGRYVAGWLFFGIELAYSLRFSIAALTTVATSYTRTKTSLRVKGDAFLPTVDVLILCTGQHDQIVMDTAMATSRLDWPIDRIRILVIDETCSSELQRRVESYASHRALHLSYHRRARTSQIKTESALKSAMINFGLTETRMHGRQAGEFTLVLEAECLPESDILRVLLPHMLQAPRLGLVQSQQGFYNLPKRMSSSFATYLNAVEPVEDTRSGFLMRRVAVDDIGGFPTESSVEDSTLSCLLTGKGYQSKTIADVLQYALLPESLIGHLKQRLARTLGPLRSARAAQSMKGRRLQQMKFITRLGYTFRAFQSLLNVDVLYSLVAFPVALCLGQFLIPVTSLQQLNILIRCLFTLTVAEKAHELVSSMPIDGTTHYSLRNRWAFLAPYQIPTILAALVPRMFKKSPYCGWNTAGSLRDRDARNRRAFIVRLADIFSLLGSWLHLLILFSLVGAVTYSAILVLGPTARGLRDSKQTFLFVLMTFGWPSLHWLNTIQGSMAALSYAVNPPTVPARDHLLIREPITGVAKPSPEWQRSRPFSHSRTVEMLCTLLTTTYISILFALTFTNLLDM